ncbi:MAG: FKBP-type peptidyl-prolyl cis-trans isomerase [Nanoarchaeota archaeon]
MELTKKGEFIEIKYTGYANGNIFDSNINEDLKDAGSKKEGWKTIIAIGEGMVVPGLDKALEGKEIGKNYDVKISVKEGFGERRKDMMRIIPLNAFTEKEVMPRPGMMLTLDNMLVKVITVSGARVTVDFNNPLAGKELEYKFSIARKVEEDKERAEALFEIMFKFIPEFEIKEKVIIKGPKILEAYSKAFSEKFKQLMGKELGFELKESKKIEEKSNSAQ